MVVLLAVGAGDGPQGVELLARKILRLRIFEDSAGKMNLDITQTGGSILLVSQFTLYGDARKGNRPSFIEAAPPEKARELYEAMAALLGAGAHVETGTFQAMMDIELVNSGPVTILLDSDRKF